QQRDRIDALSSRTHRRLMPLAARLRLVGEAAQLWLDIIGGARHAIDKAPKALMPFDVRQALAAHDQKTKLLRTIGLQDHEEALHIRQPPGFLFLHDRTIEKEDVAALQNSWLHPGLFCDSMLLLILLGCRGVKDTKDIDQIGDAACRQMLPLI